MSAEVFNDCCMPFLKSISPLHCAILIVVENDNVNLRSLNLSRPCCFEVAVCRQKNSIISTAICYYLRVFDSFNVAVPLKVCDHFIASGAQQSRQLCTAKVLVSKKDMTTTAQRTL